MQHFGTKILESQRLLLRPFTVEDADAMYRNWASDSAVTKFLSWPVHTSPDMTTELLQDWVSQYPEEDYYQWAIVLKSMGEPVGSISVVSLDSRVSKAEVGYCIGRNWWRQGITSEAFGLVIDYLLGEVGLNRLEACHDTNNPHSGAVMRKCGLLYEGTALQSRRNNQGLCDICHYAILAQDWHTKHKDSPGETV